MKIFHYIIICIFTLNILNCSDNNNLNGLWEINPEAEYITSIEFSGKNFITIEYYWYDWGPDAYMGSQHTYLRINRYLNKLGTANNIQEIIKTEQSLDWIRYPKIPYEENIRKEGKDILREYYDQNENIFIKNVSKGKYSISENQIELLFPDGTIEIYPFSRTENTITIFTERYIRKNKR